MGEILETGYKVCDAMTESPITISANKTLRDAAKLMAKEHVGALLVKEDGNLIGVFTEQDIVRKAVALPGNPSTRKVKEIMEKTVTTIAPEADIFDAIRVMRDYNIRHLPVVSDSKLIGLVTLKDILKIEPDLFDLLVEKFELREESRKPVYRVLEAEGVCENCGEYSESLEWAEGQLLCPKCHRETYGT